MSYIQFVVTLALALDAFWAGIATSSPPPNKAAVKEWQASVEAGYAEIGMDNNNLFPPIFSFENGSGWLGMTGGQWHRGCLRSYSLNTTLLNPTSPYYDTPEWRAVVAHEVAHVYQGVLCANNIDRVESSAVIAHLSVLAQLADTDPNAAEALIYDLRRLSILAALDAGERGILDDLQLSEAERAYFESITPQDLRAKGNLYWTRTLSGIYGELFAGDGEFERDERWLYWGELDASALAAFVEGLLR